jgi:hypothetical protein
MPERGTHTYIVGPSVPAYGYNLCAVDVALRIEPARTPVAMAGAFSKRECIQGTSQEEPLKGL